MIFTDKIHTRMWTEHIFLIRTALQLRARFRASKISLSHHLLPADFVLTFLRRFLFNSFFICASVFSFVAFVLSLFVPNLSDFGCF